MKLELKNIKYAEFNSEETNCFQATLHINGQKALRVSNEGHGGPDDHEELYTGAYKEFDDYCKTLPPEDFHGHPLQPSPETVVGDLLTDHLMVKDLKRLMKGKLLYSKKDGQIYEAKVAKPILSNQTALTELVFRMRAKYPDIDQVLNLLDFDKAFAVFKKSSQIACP